MTSPARMRARARKDAEARPTTVRWNAGAPSLTMGPVQTTSGGQLVANTSLNVNLDQWANLAGQGWQNGDLNKNNSAYHEGDVVPFRLAIEGLSGGQHTNHLNYDFTAGGHDHVYEFVPQGEVWIDSDIEEKERGFVLLHELHERNRMAVGWSYDKAHAESSRLEYHCRHHPDDRDVLAVDPDAERVLGEDVRQQVLEGRAPAGRRRDAGGRFVHRRCRRFCSESDLGRVPGVCPWRLRPGRSPVAGTRGA